MKKIFIAKTVKVLAAFCILFSAISCKNSVVPDSGKEQTSVQTQEKEVYVTINVQDVNSIINGTDNAGRTIQPDVDVADLTDYVLSGGRNTNGSNSTVEVLGTIPDYNALDGSNPVRIKVPYDAVENEWYFTLSAKYGDNTFKGNTTASLSEGDTNTLSFTLSLTEFEDGDGAIAVTVKFNNLTQGNPADVTSAAVVLTDMQGNEVKDSSDNTITPTVGLIDHEDNDFIFAVDTIPNGYYKVRIALYSGAAEVASWPDIVFVTAGVTTLSRINISYLNPVYDLSYVLNNEDDEITYENGITPPNEVTPSVKQIPTPKRDGYIFNGWYFDEGLSTPLTFPITQDRTLYASWVSESATASTVADTIAAIKVGTKEAPAVIKVTGTISTTTISNISTALDNNSSVYFAIDLSGTTGLATLASMAFYHLENLVSIELPETVTTINNSAFAYSGLTAITIPASVTNIGDSVFAYCIDLEKISFANNSECTSIGSSVFENCKSLTSITIPASVTGIGSRVFYNCTALTSIIIPDNVESIGANAFSECSSLKSVTLPENDNFTTISDYLFSNCEALESVIISDSNSINTIGDSAFYGCKALEEFTIPSGVTSIGANAFCSCSSLTEIDIPSGVTTLSDYLFCGCSSLISVTWPESYTSIGKNAFDGTAITSLTIPQTLTTIGDKAFDGCKHLATITVEDGNTNFVLDVGILYALDDNDDLSSIAIIPGKADSVIIGSIEGSTFSFADSFTLPNSCFAHSNIREITIGDNISELPEKCFYESNVEVIHLGENVQEMDNLVFYGCEEIEEITVDEDNSYFMVDNGGALMTSDEKEIILYPAASSATSYVIPESVTCIKEYAFFKNKNLESITFENPDGVWYKITTYCTSPAEIMVYGAQNGSHKLSSDELSNAQDLLVNTNNYVYKVDMDAFYENTDEVDVYYGQNLDINGGNYTVINETDDNVMAYRFHAVPGKDYTINWVDEYSYNKMAFTNIPSALNDCEIYIIDENGDGLAYTHDGPYLSITAPTETIYVIINGWNGLKCAFRVWKTQESSNLGFGVATDITVTETYDSDTGSYTYVADDGYEEYCWFVDNNYVGTDNPTFVLDPSKFNVGAHTLHLEARFDGYYYTYTKQFYVDLVH